MVFSINVFNGKLVSLHEAFRQVSLLEKQVNANMVHLEEFSRLSAQRQGSVQNET